MYCPHCGRQVQQDQNFCSGCGRPITGSASATAGVAPSAEMPAPPPVLPAPPVLPTPAVGMRPGCRLEQHLRILGVLWLVFSVMRALPGLTLLGIGHFGFGRFGFPFSFPFHGGFLAPLLGSIGVFLSVTAIAGIAAGWGLLDRRPWARTLAIVLGIIKLLEFPIGTALGVYTLWVLVSPGAEVEYQRIARVN
jgi:apolipoprotein N-acyltransferase